MPSTSTAEELVVTATTLRRVRVGAMGFVVLQFWLYEPSVRAGSLPWPRWPVAGMLILALAAINVASRLAGGAAAGDRRRLVRAAWLEVLLDTGLAVALVVLFGFDEDVRLWPLLAFPILEAGYRLQMRGAIGGWAVASAGYVIDQVLRLPTREDPEAWVGAIPFAAGILLMIAVVSGKLSAGLTGSRDVAQARAEELERRTHDLDRAVDELTTAHAELERQRSAAEEANAAKDVFLSRMSHELRTPMNAVLGFSQLLELSDLDDEQAESVAHIRRAGRHLLSLIDEVLDISRIEAGELGLSVEPVHLEALLSQAVDLVWPQASGRDVSMTVDGSVSPVVVLADQQRLLQVLLNLLANAVKYNRPGGSVSVSAEVHEAGQVRLTVADTGIGIAPEAMERVFAPFDRLGAEGSDVQGTGLGLALSRRLVQAMGGTIGAESTLGEGSRFWVELPTAGSESPAAPASLSSTPTSPVQARVLRGRVLYIEDNLANLALVERVVRRLEGVEIVSAMQGRLGVQLALDHPPDVVLLDLHLPDIDGRQVLARLRDDERTKDVPVIVLSADANPKHIQRLKEAGADGYLTKPLDVAQLLENLAGLLAVPQPDPAPETPTETA